MKRAIVIGATSGIGKELAKMLVDNNTDWFIGNRIPFANDENIRSLKDPKNYGKHVENNQYVLGQPNTYNGGFWYSGNADNGGVHINSGVQNKWFFILTTGENGTNDNNDYYSVNGIGMDRSANIAYYTLTNYLMSSSNYYDSRQASITVAKNLYGECSPEYISTMDAWYAVGVGGKNKCQTTSIEELADLDLKVYPNPAQNLISIELPHATNQQVSIYTLDGKYIDGFNSSEKSFTRDISNLSNGVYFIKFLFNEGEVTKKIIIQR